MALLHSFEKSGNYLFRHRGQIPVLLFIAAIPAIYFTDYSQIGGIQQHLFIAFSIALSVFGFLVRGYAIATTPRGTSGRNTDKQVAEVLNHTGIYSTVRHPLYLGNYFMWIGIVLYTFNISFVLIVSLAYWIYYERIMFAEERFLERKFGDKYIDWSLSVPAFIPSFKRYIPTAIPFSIKTLLRREYSGVLATVFGFVFIDVCRDFIVMHSIGHITTSMYVLVVTMVIAFVLRTIKHKTSWLKEADRS